MKRLAVLVKNEKVDAVVASLRELNLDAIIYDVKSAGKEKETCRHSDSKAYGTWSSGETARCSAAERVDGRVTEDSKDRQEFFGQAKGKTLARGDIGQGTAEEGTGYPGTQEQKTWTEEEEKEEKEGRESGTEWCWRR